VFSSRQQLARVCEVLTRGCGGPGERLWIADGPTPRARELHEQPPSGMTGGQRVLLQLAFCLWEGGKGPPLGSALSLLGGAHLRLVGGLLVALSEDASAIDRWVRLNGGPAGDA
jgi:hypothetical protein